MRGRLSKFQFRSTRSQLAHFVACARGVTAIEFAFVAPMVFAIMLAAVQIATLYVAQSYLEAITESAMRIVLTNQSSNYTATTFKTALCQNVTALFDCNSLIVDLQPIEDCTAGTLAQITTCLNSHYVPQFDPGTGALTNPPTFNVGKNKEKVRLLVMYQWPIISGPLGMSLSPNGVKLLSAVQIFYKEPCLVTNTACMNNG